MRIRAKLKVSRTQTIVARSTLHEVNSTLADILDDMQIGENLKTIQKQVN
jgi:hypothetical protein